MLANYHRACNLVTTEGEIIALVGPSVGNGPLNIVIEDISSIGGSAALLVGLGPGLTPAGDGYLVGLMAGLRVWPGLCEVSSEEACRIILDAAEDRTTLLSRALLRSAKEGLFRENWHELLAELAGGEVIRIRQAVRRILSAGATSGADALAGFLSPYLWQQRLASRKAQKVL